MIPVFLAAGHRVGQPDLFGDDKPKKDKAHHFNWHRQVLPELVEHLVSATSCWWCRTGITGVDAADNRLALLRPAHHEHHAGTGDVPYPRDS